MEISEEKAKKIFGGSCLEFHHEMQTKYLVATEQGLILSLSKKPKKDVPDVTVRFGIDQEAHHGPVLTCQRNPKLTKFFLSVADWTARVWNEENIKTPIICTR